MIVSSFLVCLCFHSSDVLHEFRIQEREAGEFVLIQIHHEQLVGGRQVQLVRRELLVEIADVFAMFLFRASETFKRKRVTD